MKYKFLMGILTVVLAVLLASCAARDERFPNMESTSETMRTAVSETTADITAITTYPPATVPSQTTYPKATTPVIEEEPQSLELPKEIRYPDSYRLIYQAGGDDEYHEIEKKNGVISIRAYSLHVDPTKPGAYLVFENGQYRVVIYGDASEDHVQIYKDGEEACAHSFMGNTRYHLTQHYDSVRYAGQETIAGRICHAFHATELTTEGFCYVYEFCIDIETGICLRYQILESPMVGGDEFYKRECVLFEIS